jgi:threonine/homoserine/homoserine lactone efflux protein
MLPSIDGFEKWIAGAGCLFLLILGGSNLINGQPKLAYPQTRFGDYLYYISTGFLLNGLNPVNFISWVGITSYLRTNLTYSEPQVVTFLIVSVIAVFLTESLIAIFAHRLKRFFTPRVVSYLNNITGIVFIGIAFRIAYVTFYL